MKDSDYMEKVKRSKDNKQLMVILGGMIFVIITIILFIIFARKENQNRQDFIAKVKDLCGEIKEQYDEAYEKGEVIHYFSNSVKGIRFQKDKLKYCAIVDNNGIITSLEATDDHYYVKTDEKNNTTSVRRSSYEKFECSKQLSSIAVAGYDRLSGRRLDVFGGNIEPHRVETITFMPTNVVPEKVLGSFDASDKKDKSVMAWYLDNDKNSMYELYIGADGGVAANRDASYMFAGLYNLTSIDMTYLDTGHSKSTEGMFYYLTNLKSLDLSNLDTSNVTNMSRMFYYLVGVGDLDLRTFDTSNVTDMSEMFLGCWSITKLNVNSFDTSKVQNMSSMFENCSKLVDVDLKKFNTKKVDNISSMFKRCYLLNDDNLHNFDVPDIDNVKSMFCDTQFNKDSKVVKTYTGDKLDSLFECD